MDERNQSAGITFVLSGFSEYPQLQMPLFLVFFTVYTVSVLGNLGMIVIIRINPKLHTPMYFFLSHLSFLDICSSSVFTPKVLGILVVEDRVISFKGCMAQFFFGCAFMITEMSMLAVMAYDWFLAVCNPLLYTVAMSPKLAAFWSLGLTCGLECVPCQSHVLFWSCPSVVLMLDITLAVSILPSSLLPVLTPISVN